VIRLFPKAREQTLAASAHPISSVLRVSSFNTKNIACTSSAAGSFLEYSFFNKVGQVSAGGDFATFGHAYIFSGCHVSDELFSGVKETVDHLPLSFVQYCLLVPLLSPL
jgi:hypothetical protein